MQSGLLVPRQRMHPTCRRASRMSRMATIAFVAAGSGALFARASRPARYDRKVLCAPRFPFGLQQHEDGLVVTSITKGCGTSKHIHMQGLLQCCALPTSAVRHACLLMHAACTFDDHS